MSKIDYLILIVIIIIMTSVGGCTNAQTKQVDSEPFVEFILRR